MPDPADYLNLSEKRRLDEIRKDAHQLRTEIQKLNAEKRMIRQRGYMRSISRRDAANAATGARV